MSQAGRGLEGGEGGQGALRRGAVDRDGISEATGAGARRDASGKTPPAAPLSPPIHG